MTSFEEKVQELNNSLEILAGNQDKTDLEPADRAIFCALTFLGLHKKDLVSEYIPLKNSISKNKIKYFMKDRYSKENVPYFVITGDEEEQWNSIKVTASHLVKTSKNVIRWLGSLSENYEDYPDDVRAYLDYKIGITFIIPAEANRILVVLTKERKNFRILELYKSLNNTQIEIVSKWNSITNFTVKENLHKDLWDSFDIEPTNKEFYLKIKTHFDDLINHLTTEKISDTEEDATQLTTRLIGRVLFCWFLDKKNILSSKNNYLSIEANSDSTTYYRNKLEPLFYNTLNTPIAQRIAKSDTETPYLNGGLFEPKPLDLKNNKKLTFPDSYFQEFYNTLHHYTFTTDESTGTYQHVAIDPEILGRIFENLLAEHIDESENNKKGTKAKKSERKSKGAYYTPRTIVDFMCKKSIRQYLVSKLHHKHPDIDTIITSILEDEFTLNENTKRKIKDARKDIIELLDKLRLLDPACGSGAFPIGMLQVLLTCYERLDSRFDPFKVKQNILQNNIYGVDILPMAIQLTRLRAWLTLTIDQKRNDVQPLPNLEFKFVCADSIMPLRANGHYQINVFDNNEDILLEKIMEDYFNATDTDIKNNIKKRYSEVITKTHSVGVPTPLNSKLKTYEPFNDTAQANFYNTKIMFGLKNKFDIVIGNPPYKQIAKGIEIDKHYFEFSAGASKKGKKNLYELFIEHSHNLAKEHGVICLIVQNTLLADKASSQIRTLLFNRTTVKLIIDFPKKTKDNSQPFESVQQGTCVLLSVKNSTGEQTENNTFKLSVGNSANTIKSLEFIDITQKELLQINPNYKEIPLVQSADEYYLFLKMKQLPHTAEDFISSINQGDFNLTTSKHEIVEYNTGVNVVRGNTIGRFHFGVSKDKWMKDTKFSEQIEQNLHSEIIVCQQIAGITDQRRMHFALASKGKYLCGNSVNKIIAIDTINKYLLLALFNSKAVEWIFRKLSSNNHVNQYEVLGLPFPDLEDEAKQSLYQDIAKLSEKATDARKDDKKADTTDLENKIDRLVYQAYNLNDNEIDIVERSFS